MLTMQTIQVQNLSLDELREMMQATFRNELKPFTETFTQQRTPVIELSENMTPKEVATYLRISAVTVWQWTKEGKLTAYRLSNRKYYKRNEVEKVLNQAKVRYS